MIFRPREAEYALHLNTYISKVPEGDLITLLEEQTKTLEETVSGLSEEQALFRYAPGKWSIKEVIGHMADAERIMAARLLRIARGDKTPLPSFDEDSFVQAAKFDDIPLKALLGHHAAVRQSTLMLLRILPDEAFTYMGTVSDYPASPRAIAYLIAGHERHHLTILRERYLVTDEGM